MSPADTIDSQTERSPEEEKLDSWRILLVNLNHLMSSYFMDVKYWEGVRRTKDSFGEIGEILRELDRMPGHGGTVLIRYRGLPSGPGRQENVDYVVEFGNIMLDSGISQSMVKRLGIRMSHLSGQLGKAFGIFSNYGISNLNLKLPGQSDESLEQIRVCLNVISRFNQSLKFDSPIVFIRNGKEISLSPVLDQRNVPDPNLTLVAALNDLSQETINDVIRKVDSWMRRSDSTKPRGQYTSVYNAIFRIKKLNEKLIKPPIEINNLELLMVEGDQAATLKEKAAFGQALDREDKISKGAYEDEIKKIGSIEKRLDLALDCFMDMDQSGDGAPKGIHGVDLEKVGSIEEKLNVVIDYLVDIEPSGGMNEALGKFLGDDFERVDSQELMGRLRLATEFLAAAEKNPGGRSIRQKVLENIEESLGNVRDEVYDGLVVTENEVKILSGEKEMSLDKIHASLSEMIGSYKKRGAAEKKIDLFIDCFMDLDQTGDEAPKGAHGTDLGKIGSIEEKLNVVIDYLVDIEPSGGMNEAIGKFLGDNFERVDSKELVERLGLATELLAAVEKNPGGQGILQEVLKNIEGSLGNVRDEVYDGLVVAENEVKARSGEKEERMENVPASLSEMIGFYKKRSGSRKKMMAMVHRTIHFEAQDYETIARDFGTSVQDSKDIVSLLKSCFDSQGHFLRGAFEKSIPEFAQHEKAFEFLWNYLKETTNRNDRVAFLNSLQLLFTRMEQPKKALKILLTDFSSDPDIVNFSDRSAMMLANLLVRDYNKEVNINIEITPEEVLLVKKGLNRETATSASQMIISDEKRFLEKIKTIHKMLIKALDPGSAYTQPMPIKYLLALEREIYIFLSLVGGSTAHSVIVHAIEEYGDPSSEIYLLMESYQYLPSILQNLKVMIRGLERVGDVGDLSLLDGIKRRKDVFKSLGEGPRHDALVMGIMRWVDITGKNITAQ